MYGISFFMRVVATLAFLLAMFGVSPGGFSMIAFVLAMWVTSTLVPPAA